MRYSSTIEGLFIANDLKSNKHPFVRRRHGASAIITNYRLAFASRRVLSVYMWWICSRSPCLVIIVITQFRGDSTRSHVHRQQYASALTTTNTRFRFQPASLISYG